MKSGVTKKIFSILPLIDSFFAYLKDFRRLGVYPALFLAFFGIASCEDSGCIEADDFGEYQTKTVTVKASQSIDSCTYDSNNRENLTHTSHGSGLTRCFTAKNITIHDASSVSHSSTVGCKHWQPLNYATNGTTTTNTNANIAVMNLCVNECINECNAAVMAGSTNPDPPWVSTDRREPGGGEIALSPGSKISMRATGNIVLGGAQDLNTLYIYPNSDSFFPTAKNASGAEIYQPVSSGDVVALRLSGGFVDGDYLLGSTTATVGNVGLLNLAQQDNLETYFSSGSNSDKRADLINAMTRVAMYIEPIENGHSYISPSSGNLYDDANVRGFPMRPLHTAWSCTYTGTDLNQASCANDISVYTTRYSGLGGSTASVTSAINSKFRISADTRSLTNVSVNGGLLKITTDNIRFKDESGYDPFSPASCPNGYDCAGVSALDGTMAYNSSSSSPSSPQIQRIGRDSQLYFKYLQSGCSGNINVKIKASTTATTDLYTYDNVVITDAWTSGGIVPPGSSSGTAPNAVHISGQSNQVVEIQRVGGVATFTPSGTSTPVDCIRSLAIKFVPYYDFTVSKSGLVSLANLAPSGASGSCNIKFRIINPTGSHASYTLPAATVSAYNLGTALTSIDADFYEYGDFNDTTAPEDASGLRLVDTNWNSAIVDKIYVRSGQKIRFAPESWAGTWTPVATLSRKCGVGMGIRIEPRPAFLCRGQGNVEVRNPSCNRRMVSGEVRGCETTSPTCLDSSTGSTTFCPDTANCVGAITLTDPSDSVTPRTGGSVTRMSYPTSGTAMTNHACSYVYALNTLTTPPSRSGLDSSKVSKCNNCQDAMLAAGLQSPVISQSGIRHCYNLENYTGKVSNIVNSYNNFFSTVPAPSTSHAAVTKGMYKLQRFNGVSGHLGDYANRLDADGFVSSSMNHYFSLTGRLMLMILDGSDFKPTTLSSSYTNNGVSAGAISYSTASRNNGFAVSLSNFLNFGNGENLEVLFCKETSSTSRVCMDPARPTHLSNVPSIRDFSSGTNSFNFDEHGNLYRTSGPRTGVNNCDSVIAGNKYFCHCRGDFSASSTDGCSMDAADGDGSDCSSVDGCRYRLSFKIRDTEVPNCVIPGSFTSTGGTAATSSNYTTLSGAAAVVAPNSTPCDNDSTTSTRDCTGIRVSNPDYVSASNDPTTGVTTQLTQNIGAFCNHSSVEPSTGCQKQYKCVSKYSNNTGQYNVVVRVKKRTNTVSGIVTAVIDPVLRVMDGYVTSSGVRVPGQAERIYKLIIQDQAYMLILKMSLILMISFYGLTFLMGLNEAGTSDIIMRIVKIGLVFMFVSDQGWTMFNHFFVGTFKHATDELTFLMATSFDDSPELLNAITTNNYTNKSILFSSVDKVMGILFSSAVLKKISALFFSGLFGWLYMMIIYYAFIAYIIAVSTAVLVYLTAQVFISILFVLGPIFFIFTLFDKTKEMFDKWLQQLIGFSLQQMFLVVTLSFFNMMMYEIIKNSLGYKVCWDEVWTINIIIRVSLMSFWTIPNIPPLFDSQAEMGSSGRGEGVPSFFSILFIWMVAKLMREFITFMSNVAADIGGGISASSLAGGIMQSAAGLSKSVGKMTKGAYHATIGHGIRRLDQKLFDSGEYANRARKAKRKQDTIDLKNKGAMVKSGREAIDDFKRKHGAELAGLSKEQQQKKLNDVRDQAMSEKGKRMGLKDSEIKRLKEDTGVKYRGDNLVGYMAQRAYRKTKAGGSVSKSITSGDVSKDLSKKQARSALKNADKKGREDMIDAVKKGEMYVRSGRTTARLSDKVGGRLLPRILESKEHKKARQQLEEEGEISKIRGLGVADNMARSDADKKKIRERLKRNEAITGKMNKKSRASTAASLEAEAQYQDVKQGDSDAEITKDWKGTVKDADGKGLRGQKVEAIKKGRLKSAREELSGNVKKFSQEAAAQSEKAAELGAEVEALEQKFPGASEVSDLAERYKKAGYRERKEIKKEMSKKGSKMQAAASLINDKRGEQKKANKLASENNKAAAEAGSQLASVDAALEVERGVDEVLGNQDSYSKEEIAQAKSAEKDLNRIRSKNFGVEGGRSTLGMIGTVAGGLAVVGTGGLAALGRKGGRGVTREGLFGSREKSTDKALASLKEKHAGVAKLAPPPRPPKPDQLAAVPRPSAPGAVGGGAPPPVPPRPGSSAPPPVPPRPGASAPPPVPPRPGSATVTTSGSGGGAAGGGVGSGGAPVRGPDEAPNFPPPPPPGPSGGAADGEPTETTASVGPGSGVVRGEKSEVTYATIARPGGESPPPLPSAAKDDEDK